MDNPTRNTNKAFSLMEILITLTIFSVISVSLYSTFSSGVSAWRKSEDTNRLYQEARWALNKIASELSNAVVYDFGQQYPDLNAFKGEEDNISFFIGTNSGIKKFIYFLQAPSYGDVYRTEVNYQDSMPSSVITDYRERTASLLSLQRKEESFIESLQLEANQKKQSKTLSSIVKEDGLSFSYAYAKISGDGNLEEIVWQESWQYSDVVPIGVKIKLSLQNPENPKEELTFIKIVFIPTGIIIESEG